MLPMIRRQITAATQGGDPWQAVTAPDGWTWTLPFVIQQNGRVFRPAPTFDLQTYANITVAKTYYVDGTSGNDTNTGLSWAQAFATPEVGWGQADADRVYLRNGYWFKNQVDSLPTRSMEIIGDGTAFITGDFRNQVGEFSQVDNHYEATVAVQTAQLVSDASILTAFGEPTFLTVRASVAEVDANAGSWYQNGATIYIRTADDRAPDTDIRYLSGYSHALTADSRVVYYENIDFTDGWARWRNSSATGGLKVYLKNCSLLSVETVGVDEAIFQGCTIKKYAGDAINHDIRNGVVGNIAEIDCDFSCGGLAESAAQASTAHNGLSILRLNGKYHDAGAQQVGDVTNCLSWCLGTEAYMTTLAARVGFYTNGASAKMWLDSCWSHDNDTYDLQTETSGTIYTRSFIGEKGVNSGTVTPY